MSDTVLVVEDEVGLAKLVRQGLRTEGMLADVAVHDPEAFRRFAEQAREAAAA